jgi:3D (Asp-Asp-Asp) domain-containing protein
VLGTGLAATGAAAPGAELRRLEAAVAPRPAPALELYALHTQISRVDARLAVLRARRDAVEAQLARLRIEVDVAWQSLYAAERVLGARIRQLYEHGQLDPVAILLGAESVDEAVGGLDGLRRLAAGDRDLLEQVTRARDGLVRAKVRVRQRAVALRAAEARAAATAQRLRAAAAERVGYFERLRSQHGYTQRRIARLNAVAQAAQRKSGAVSASAAAVTDVEVREAAAETPPAAPAPVAAGRTQITVVATGYAIRGRTATGLSAGWGVVAVDPDVIPLGTRMTIPGYGEGVAADTGGAVQGNVIDLWFPTVTQALAWGRRIVRITLRG